MASIRAREEFRCYESRVKENFYDTHTQNLVKLYLRPSTETNEQFLRYGAVCAHEMDDLAKENNHVTNLPRLTPYDGFGNRTEGVTFPHQYHQIGRLVYSSGIMSRYATPGKELETLALHYMTAQNGEAGHTCPLACTAGLIKSLQAEPQQNADTRAWLEKLLTPDYDTHFHGSQFLTEVQGGSDVGANELRAVPSGAKEGWYELTGEKWFCSVVDAHLWLVVARPEGVPQGTAGLRGFVVPRSLKTGEVNYFRVRRLKDKLGTRSMASAEIDFCGALAYPLAGDFRKVLTLVINTSRLYNAVTCSAMMQRSYIEAASYAAHRTAFGQRLIEMPAIAATVAKLNSEAHGARAVTFFLAHMNDELRNGSTGGFNLPQRDVVAALRMILNMNKYWTAERVIAMVHEAIDVFGGNGAIEEFSILPRLLRDAVVCAQWEGPHNTLCAQVLKDSARLALHKPMFAFLRQVGTHDRLSALEEAWEKMLLLPQDGAALRIRGLVDNLRPIVQCLLLKREVAKIGNAVALAAAQHIDAAAFPQQQSGGVGDEVVSHHGCIRALIADSMKSQSMPKQSKL